jgi:protein TonB
MEVCMDSRLQSFLALAGVIALHGGAIGLAMWAPSPKTQELVLPTVQGILLPARPAETVQAPSAKEQPQEPTPPPPEEPKPKPKPKPKEPPKPKPPVELPPSERAIQQPEVSDEPPPLPPPQAAIPALADNDSLGAPITPPQMDANPLNNPAPAYPTLSRRMGEQGVVLLEILILPDGSVGEIRVKESSGFKRLDETAVKAVKRWRYTPAKRGSTAIEYWYLQPVEFSLH